MAIKPLIFMLSSVASITVMSTSGHLFAQDNTLPLQQAQAAIEEGRYQEAEDILNTIIANEPNSAEAHYQLGISLHQQYRLKEAILAYQSAIDSNPDYDAPYVNLGLAWIEGQRPEKAIAVFQQILERPDREGSPVSNHTLAHYNLAIIYKRQEKFAEALSATQAALDISPSFEQAQSLLEILQETH